MSRTSHENGSWAIIMKVKPKGVKKKLPNICIWHFEIVKADIEIHIFEISIDVWVFLTKFPIF